MKVFVVDRWWVEEGCRLVMKSPYRCGCHHFGDCMVRYKQSEEEANRLCAKYLMCYATWVCTWGCSNMSSDGWRWRAMNYMLAIWGRLQVWFFSSYWTHWSLCYNSGGQLASVFRGSLQKKKEKTNKSKYHFRWQIINKFNTIKKRGESP